jgi:phospho-N-acetylmuramoyl-pentapeptide-transferase
VIGLLIAALVSTVVSLVATRAVILFFRNRGKGQPILGKDEKNLIAVDHQHKAGTPTMGGIAILVAALTGYLVAHIREGIVFSDQAQIVWLGIALMAGVGFVDDFLKVKRMRNRGVFWRVKNLIVLALAAVPVILLVTTTEIATTISFTRADWPGWDLGVPVWVVFSTFIVYATTHAVNVTDGLDGLAGGAALFAFLAFTVVAFWGFRNPDLYDIVNPLDLAVLAVALAGACAGFLWFNAAPAKVFMGDVGALGLGAGLALLALTTQTQLLLPLLCAINVIEIGSVAIQMGVYKASGRTRRVFRMSPIHHHFEVVGWPETTVIIRFWLIAGGFVAIALGIYIADFTRMARL